MYRILSAFCLLLFPFFSASAVSPNDEIIKAKVLSVYDGDTFTVEVGGEEEKVRILGIDTPEITASDRKNTCGGKEAKALLSALILNKEVTLARDSQNDNRDAFGRLLRSVRLNGRLDVSILLLITGRALVYEKADFASKPLYLKLQSIAGRLNRGIWGECDQTSDASGSTPSPSSYTGGLCSTKAACGRLTTCDEAKYYLNTCGQKSLDQDGDGTPCEELCK